MTKSYSDKVKARIAELCPDIMELKFGCEVELDTSLFTGKEEAKACLRSKAIVIAYDKGGYNGQDYDDDHANFYSEDWGIYGDADGLNLENPEDEEYVKVLGSPITLAVVLRSIEAHEGDRDNTHFVTMDGEFYRCSAGNNYPPQVTAVWWNLLHDSYDLQSEETKRFVGTLLGIPE